MTGGTALTGEVLLSYASPKFTSILLIQGLPAPIFSVVSLAVEFHEIIYGPLPL